MWFIILTFLGGCQVTQNRPDTPDGAHRLFARSLSDRNYRQTYDLLASSSRSDFSAYVATTREVVRLIRTQYPASLQPSAINDLSVRFGFGEFTFADIEADTNAVSVFVSLCRRMLADSSGFSVAEVLAESVADVRYHSSDSAVVTTLAGETLTYIREADGLWRTREVFGKRFAHLLRLSRSNLDVTQANAELYRE